MKHLDELWAEGKCPIINGISYPDGRVEEVEPIDDSRAPGTTFIKLRDSRYVAGFDSKHCTTIGGGQPTLEQSSSASLDAERGIVALCGEGAWGGEGFVAVATSTNQLRWIAYFDFSNPFVSVEFSEDAVVAMNNHGETWRFPLASPWSIRIDTPDRRRHSQS